MNFKSFHKFLQSQHCLKVKCLLWDSGQFLHCIPCKIKKQIMYVQCTMAQNIHCYFQKKNRGMLSKQWTKKDWNQEGKTPNLAAPCLMSRKLDSSTIQSYLPIPHFSFRLVLLLVCSSLWQTYDSAISNIFESPMQFRLHFHWFT